MWILPHQLHTSAFVPDTAALISDLNEQSQVCAQSLLVRSKVSPARTWSLKWKRDSWTQLLSGRILKPSHGPSFTAAWTSSLAAIRASHSAQPASASAPKTRDTSGRLSQPELLQCDQVPVSLKTSRDISALGFPTCCKTWQEWVTERRGAWRARVNAARLIRGSGSLSWPTVQASEEKANRYRDGSAKGAQIWLTTAVVKDAASWPTPNAQVSQDGESPETWLKRKEAMKAKGYNGNGCGTPLTIAVQLHGQADPASSNTSGSRQELWPTPEASQGGRQSGSFNQTSWKHADGTPRQPSLAQAALSSQAKEMWPTITAHTPDMESNGPNGHQGTYLAGAVKQWATPRAGKTTDENPDTWAARQAKGDVATMPLTAQVKAWATPAAFDWNTAESKAAWEKRAAEQKAKGVNLHLPLKSQAIHEAEKQWATPKASDPQHAGPNMRDSAGNYALPAQVTKSWLTPKVPSGGSQAVRTTEGGGLRKLEDQTQTPTGKLNPRWVETLMGLPIGWTMPSCTSPQTIAPMSCDSSAMELCRPPQSELSEFSLAS